MAENIESKIRDYVDAFNKKDLDRALSFFADDATWSAPEGTFKGKEEINKYMTWVLESLHDETLSDDGIGIIVQGDKAVYQHTLEGTIEGNKYKVPSICIYEFSGEKCKNHWSLLDRITIAKQTVTGPIARKVVNTTVNRMEKGL